MHVEPQGKQPDLWNQVLEVVAANVPPHCFDTWFRPLTCAGCEGHLCEIIAPNETFLRGLLDNFSSVLDDAFTRVAGASHRLKISAAGETLPGGPSPFRVLRASELESAEEQRPWLIERLWSAEAVGMVCGPPKALKTWTALEMAVSVASGVACLGTFPVHRSGPVLLYTAEDPLPAVRLRLESLAHSHGLELDQVDVRIIAADSLRLDRAGDREKLAATVRLHQPVLLILDPLIRLHGLDENQAGPMAELLGYFRALQRETGMSIAIIHHSRKNIAPSATAGQSLRGSSDLYAFVDSLVSLNRRRNQISLSAEHRSAQALGPLALELISDAQGLSLKLGIAVTHDSMQEDTLPHRIMDLLENSDTLMTTDAIRSSLQVRKQRVVDVLRRLCDQGRVIRQNNGYVIKDAVSE